MDFLEVIKQARAALQSEGRLTYRVLKRQFALDDEALEDLKEQLIDAEELAIDKDGKMLVWRGEEGTGETEKRRNGESKTSSQLLTPKPRPPSSYTPVHLAERIRAEQAAMDSRGSANGERKTITALFADLKGSTALIEGLDPEEAQAVIDPALQLMMDAVHQYDGFVAQALGDGIFALFGAPLAHEDHPQRALYAALRMQDTMRRYADTLRQQGYPPLLMRVGLNTGEVVLRSIRKDDLHTDYVPVGHSTNLAARMEQLATPGSIVVSAYTHRLTDGYFAFKDLGPTQIKGVEESLNIYEVLGAGPLRTRLQVSASRYGLTRFVGRQREMEQLTNALEQAKAGHGQIVGVIGEPGLGKSRLFYEFKLTSQSDCLVLEAFSVSHGKASPYLPLIELLKAYFAIEPRDDERKRREKVTGKVLALERSLEDTLPYLFALLSIADDQSSLQQMDAQIRRQRTFAALKKLFLRESLNQPLLLIFEDLHWIDSETQGFLDTLSESVASASVLLLVNYRPEYRHEWGQKTYYTQLRLAPLGKGEADELLTFLLGSDASLQALKALILDQTEGTPFFMEEVVQTLAEEGAVAGDRGHYWLENTPSALHISPTVQGVLAARIDRLTAEEKTLLQQLSVIGRQFPVSLVKQVVQQSEADLSRALASLQAKEFLYEQPAFPESEYLFKHALTQEVAYGAVLQEQRKALHECTGQAMEALYAASLDDYYSELAHHYRLSDNAEKAVEYLRLAGQQSLQRSAYEEAIHFLTTALELVRTCPDMSEREERELAVQLALGPALMVTKGFAAPEVKAVYLRARELCQQVGEASELVRALWGLASVYNLRGEWQKAQELAEQLLRLAQWSQDPTALVSAHMACGVCFYGQGKLVAALDHLEQGMTLYDPQQHSTNAFLSGLNFGVFCQGQSARVLWLLGYPDQAQKRIDAALTLAQELSHLNSLAIVLTWVVGIYTWQREPAAVHEQAATLMALATEQGLPFYFAVGTIHQGWARALQGEVAEGIRQLRYGVAQYQATGAGGGVTSYLGLLAEACQQIGEVEEGLTLLTEALAVADRAEENNHAAELYRLQGELTLRSARTSSDARVTKAEACFRQAIAIAQQQQAKSWELRAATSLARLWQSQGKTTEAHDLLTPVYNWFTEGFDTKDLQEAKALLKELE